MNWFKKANKIILYRGELFSGKKGNYFTPDKEFARQFTRSGRDNEIRQLVLDDSKIYRKSPLPSAYGNDAPGEKNDIDIAIEEAKRNGFNAIWVDEGQGQPNSVFFINRT